MTKPIVKIVNCETGEELEREMTDLEYADYLVDQAAVQAENAAEAEKAAAKQALLDKLGITAEEAALLLGGN